MSLDFVALVVERPDPGATLTGMSGPQGRLDVRVGPGAVHIHDPSGPLLVSVEAPILVEVAGEVERLLGLQAPTPIWWVDIRAAVEPQEAEIMAHGIGAEFVRRYGGVFWTGQGPSPGAEGQR